MQLVDIAPAAAASAMIVAKMEKELSQVVLVEPPPEGTEPPPVGTDPPEPCSVLELEFGFGVKTVDEDVVEDVCAKGPMTGDNRPMWSLGRAVMTQAERLKLQHV